MQAQEAMAAEAAFVEVAKGHPTLAVLYGDETQELIARAYQVQQAYHQKTGQIPSREEIADYLESVESRRYAKLMKQVLAKAPSKTVRPVAAASAPKPFEQMTHAEQRRHLMRIAEEAQKNYRPQQ
jgi:ABC-type glycerol-3-phosphate transport system substrate-binding protein